MNALALGLDCFAIRCVLKKDYIGLNGSFHGLGDAKIQGLGDARPGFEWAAPLAVQVWGPGALSLVLLNAYATNDSEMEQSMKLGTCWT